MSGKKVFLASLFAIVFFAAETARAAVTFDTKSVITVSATPVERITETSVGKAAESKYEQKNQFGGTYVQGDFALSNEKISAGGKIRCWVKPSVFSSDSISYTMDIKRAFLRYRPFGTNLLEFSFGKMYSYYLPGNYFSLADFYTGASRWGKTGAGIKSEYKGFLLGTALQMTESNMKIADYFGISVAAGYDFSTLNKNIPVKFGADFNYVRTGADYSLKDDITDSADYDFSECVSLYYTPKLDGIISKVAMTLTYSHNFKPYVSNAAYKKVANYNNSDMEKSQFVSWNYRNYFGPVQFLTEGEAGHSISGDMIPIYAGTQLLIPMIGETVWFKPRFFYYAALDTENDKNSRTSFEFYPRVWITSGKYTVSAGADIFHKEYEKDVWKWEWEIPLFVQYKVGK